MKEAIVKKLTDQNVIVLKGLRYREGFTQRQIADKLGVSFYKYTRMEYGHTKLDKSTINKLAIILNTHTGMFELLEILR